MDRLHGEMDIINFITESRINKMVSVVTLRKSQIKLIKWFRAYHIKDYTAEML